MARERYSGQEVAAGRYSEVDDAVKERSGERLEKKGVGESYGRV
jgi:hypothetical protein